MSLFPDIDTSPLGTEGRKEGAKPSADRARTQRQKLKLANGLHPTGNGAIDTAHTCGECVHCVLRSNGNRHWHKCDASHLGTSSSAASDIRISWPACPKFERQKETA